MMHTTRFFRAFAGFTSAGLLSLTLSHATVLNFENLLLNDGDLIPEYYGDRVDSSGVDAEGRTGFDLTYGATPNVRVRMYYGRLERLPSGFDTRFIWHRDGQLRFSSTSHFDLQNLAYSPEANKSLFIFLEADPNYLVTVHLMETSALRAPAGGRVQGGVFTGSTFDFNMNSTYGFDFLDGRFTHPLGPPIYTARCIVVHLTYNATLAGIDNIGFSQELIPEPASLLALGAGLTGLISLRRRKRYGTVSKQTGV